jgi:hypothetical protein
MSSSETYFRCGGCGRFVPYSKTNEHYKSDHKDGIAVEDPPAPATVANPAPPPGWAVPPARPEPKTPGGVGFDILLMRRDYPKAFTVYTLIIFAVSSLIISNLMLWILFHV